jgi:hypothetical protein
MSRRTPGSFQTHQAVEPQKRFFLPQMTIAPENRLFSGATDQI